MVSLHELAEFMIDAEENDIRLHDAAFTGNIDSLRCLLLDDQCKLNINNKTRPFGASPLRLAATGGHRECVKLLIKSGASIDSIDVKGQTPLFVAVTNHHTGCIEELLYFGANADGDDRNRCTPLHQLLLRYGASTEIPLRLISGVPVSPLHVSLLYQHYECFVTLLLAGAESDLRFIQPSLPPSALSTICLFHCIILYRLPVKFAELLVIFGGYLWQRDDKNRLAIDLPQECDSKQYIKDSMCCPLSLQNLCRIKIRRILGRFRLHGINLLPVPPSVQKFLSYNDILN